MTQVLFAAATLPLETDLDANFTQLYNLRELISTASYTAATPRVTIDGTGNVLFGQSVSGLANSNSMALVPSGGYGIWNHVSGTATGTNYAYFGYGASTIGSIAQSGTTGVAYNTSSDYRLKASVTPMAGSGAFIDALKPCTWTWISDGTTGAGFIAHELQAVSPTSVTGTKDAVDADGNPVYQAVEYGSAEVIAMLVAEIQSLRARLRALDGH